MLLDPTEDRRVVEISPERVVEISPERPEKQCLGVGGVDHISWQAAPLDRKGGPAADRVALTLLA